MGVRREGEERETAREWRQRQGDKACERDRERERERQRERERERRKEGEIEKEQVG